MLAAYYTRFGHPRDVLQLGELATPEPTAGEVRVRLAVAGLNPVDWKVMAGQRSASMPFACVVPCSDGAGIIDAVGEGVSTHRVGQRVWVINGQVRRSLGAAAQYIAIGVEHVHALPDSVPLEVGACLGIPALTAYRALTLDGPVRGQQVLITGGAGAVGHYAIQIAKAHGARVLTTVSSEDKAGHAWAAGADAVIDYKRESVGARVLELTEGQGVDRILETDLAANVDSLLPSLKQGGIVAIYGSATDMAPKIPVAPFLLKDARLHFVSVFVVPDDARCRAVNEINQMLERGELKHTIAATLPLTEIVAAYDMVIEGRQLGKVLLAIDAEEGRRHV